MIEDDRIGEGGEQGYTNFDENTQRSSMMMVMTVCFLLLILAVA
jgi:hypothetical protein